MNDYFNLLGFKINTKKFLISVGVFFALVLTLVLIDLLLFKIKWYGFLMGCAFILAVIISAEIMPCRGLKKDFPYDLIWWIFPLSIIGARTAYIVNFPAQFPNLYEMIAVWNGGLSIYGGVIGGMLGLVICCIIKKVNPIPTMDCIAPVLILGQAIGRWGNFFNEEIYGYEITNSSLKWFPMGVQINGVWHYATFFYESMLDFLGFFILLAVVRKTKQKGIVASCYFVYYGFIRFFLENLREDQFKMFIPETTIPWSKLVSIITFSIGVLGLIACLIIYLIKRRNKSETPNAV